MAQEEGRRARKRSKNAPSYGEVKAAIDAKEKAAAERKAERKSAKKPLTPAEKYEQEKAARAKKGSSGYGYSQHLMGGSGSSSSFNPRSVREEVLVDYLLGEGFASNEKSAQAIANAMSEDWKQSIVEGYGGKEEDCVDKKDKNKHNCAKKVCHEKFGEGTCIYGQHAEPDRNGFVSYYDVLFEHGIEKAVPTIEMKILVSESHGTHMKK
jgi:hypothetical protein